MSKGSTEASGTKLCRLAAPFRQAASALRHDTQGAVMVEYTVLIGAVAIAGSIGLTAVGIAIAENFEFVRGMLLIPIP
jgi:Flp pilus assembly pilin Flp